MREDCCRAVGRGECSYPCCEWVHCGACVAELLALLGCIGYWSVAVV